MACILVLPKHDTDINFEILDTSRQGSETRMNVVKVCVLTCSDTCSQGLAQVS